MEVPICPKCKKPMENLGNIFGVVYTSMPSQQDIVFVCEKDKMKTTIRMYDSVPPSYSYLSDFKELS